MSRSRRELVAGAAGAAALGMMPHALSALGASKEDTSPQAILASSSLCQEMCPSKFPHPRPTASQSSWWNPTPRRRCSWQRFQVVCALRALRQADSPDVIKTITAQQLELDASVWSSDSATFNPPT